MINNDSPKGMLFNIQRYCIHDGPGIRTTVFIKGCPMRCIWCQNPESQRKEFEFYFDPEKCSGCGMCIRICPNDAITIRDCRSQTDREACNLCGMCVDICPNGARSLVGKYVSAEEVYKEVAKDAAFYRRSGGGVTVSGGEATTSPEFVIALLKRCQDAGMHTALDTCGYVEWEVLSNIIDYSDLVLYDIKIMDPEEHRKYCGVPNNTVLNNAKKLVRLYDKHPMIVRVPIIPGCTDSSENIDAIARFVAKELGTFIEVNLLNYNLLGESKYRKLESEYSLDGTRPFSDDDMNKLKEKVESYGLKTVIIG